MIIVRKLTTLVVITSWYFIQGYLLDKVIIFQKLNEKAIYKVIGGDDDGWKTSKAFYSGGDKTKSEG